MSVNYEALRNLMRLTRGIEITLKKSMVNEMVSQIESLEKSLEDNALQLHESKRMLNEERQTHEKEVGVLHATILDIDLAKEVERALGLGLRDAKSDLEAALREEASWRAELIDVVKQAHDAHCEKGCVGPKDQMTCMCDQIEDLLDYGRSTSDHLKEADARVKLGEAKLKLALAAVEQLCHTGYQGGRDTVSYKLLVDISKLDEAALGAVLEPK